MLAAGCTGLDALNPICQAGSIGGSIASSGFESVLNGISQWVASGAEWLLDQIGDVLSVHHDRGRRARAGSAPTTAR